MSGSPTLARPGVMFPDVVLPTLDGTMVQLEAYRGRRNLVLVFTGGASGSGPVTRLLDGLGARRGDVAAEAAQILVVATSEPAGARDGAKWAFPILVDHEARLHSRVGAMAAGAAAPAVFVTDRFREIYGAYVPGEGSVLPGAQEVVDWLVFINIQCPECGAPEWPL